MGSPINRVCDDGGQVLTPADEARITTLTYKWAEDRADASRATVMHPTAENVHAYAKMDIHGPNFLNVITSIADHLSSCPKCQARLAAMKAELYS